MKATWEMKKLGEICEENIKSPFKVEDATNSGEYPFFTSGEGVLTHDEYLVDGENIFLATGGYANVKYYNGKASYSADTWSLKVKNALTRFVYYQISARLKYIDEVLFRGSGLRHLQKKEFLNLEIPIPPLSVQQKIVKILDTIQSAVEIQEKIIEKTKELKKSLMNLLFHYGLAGLRVKELASSRVGELTSSEIEKLGLKLKKTEIGEIPEDWEVVRLGDEKLFELIMGQSPPSSSYNQNKKGLPFLQGKAEFGEIYPQPIKWCDKPIKVAEKNDILISVRAPVGDLNLADQKYCVGRGLAAIRLKNNVDSFFHV
jgi:type I restriction enzyme S subunit